MADQSMIKSVVILCNFLSNVAFLIFLADFIILNYEVNFNILIHFGRPFLATGRELVDMEMGDIKFKLND